MSDSEKVDLRLKDMSFMKKDMPSIRGDMSSMREEVASLELTLENVTNRNLNIIAERCLDISKKLNDVIRIKNENKLLLIRMDIIENEIKLLKEKTDILKY